MENTKKKRLMVLAENILICKKNQRRNRKQNDEYQRFINEFMGPLRELMEEYLRTTGSRVYRGTGAKVTLGLDHSIKITR